jgi:hypothetical protein
MTTVPPCSLYLASSTLLNAGLGVFAGVSMQPGQVFHVNDLAIPLIDYSTRSNFWTEASSTLLRDYVWELQAMGMDREAPRGCALCPGVLAATNCFPPLTNIEGSRPEYQDDWSLSQRGAITLYSDYTVTATRYIPAGGELFLDYGDSWLLNRGMVQIPQPDDLDAIQDLLERFVALTSHASESLHQDLWKVLQSLPFSSSLTAVFTFLNTSHVHAVAQNDDWSGVYRSNTTRSMAELQQHGTCMDQIYTGRSNLPEAGRGAFAARDFHENQVITTTPLIPILDEEVLFGNNDEDKDAIKRRQLLVNYCWGHEQSTLLLCPYSSGISYINHYNNSRANLKVQWTTNGRLSHNSTYLNLSLHEFPQDKIVLAFDYVALREIRRGEELFVDAGEAWEHAWMSHKPPSEQLASARVWNERSDEPLRTRYEEPYPSNIFLHCHSVLTEDYWDWKRIVLEKGHDLWQPHERGHRCNILQRYHNNSEWLYNVNFFVDPNDDEVQYRGVPRSVFRFVDAYFSTDMHHPNAFRKPYQIPQDMMPKQWKNKDVCTREAKSLSRTIPS